MSRVIKWDVLWQLGGCLVSWSGKWNKKYQSCESTGLACTDIRYHPLYTGKCDV